MTGAETAEREHLAGCAACRESRGLAETVAESIDVEVEAPQGGRFEIVRCLGKGGMGVVYEAIDHERGCRVALKRLRDPRPELLCRFKQELRALRTTHHPGCVRPLDLVEEGDDWFITME